MGDRQQAPLHPALTGLSSMRRGEHSFLCRGEFGRAPRGLLAGGALEAIATFWLSMTARRVSEDLFLTGGLYFLFDRALFLFYVEARVL
jgi:hypothetical protein